MTFKNTIWRTLILQGEIAFQCPKKCFVFLPHIIIILQFTECMALRIIYPPNLEYKGYHLDHTKTVLELIYQNKLAQM